MYREEEWQKPFGDKFSRYFEGLGSMGECCVCGAKTSGSLEFCKTDYRRHLADIKDKKPWVKLFKNDAQRERRRKEREFDNTSLDSIVDRSYGRERY